MYVEHSNNTSYNYLEIGAAFEKKNNNKAKQTKQSSSEVNVWGSEITITMY